MSSCSRYCHMFAFVGFPLAVALTGTSVDAEASPRLVRAAGCREGCLGELLWQVARFGAEYSVAVLVGRVHHVLMVCIRLLIAFIEYIRILVALRVYSCATGHFVMLTLVPFGHSLAESRGLAAFVVAIRWLCSWTTRWNCELTFAEGEWYGWVFAWLMGYCASLMCGAAAEPNLR